MDKVLKQRLVGATILIALAVIFVPMFFDEEPGRDQARDSAVELPPPPADSRSVRRLPLDPDQAREVPPEREAERAAPEPPDREISLLEPDTPAPDEPTDDAPDLTEPAPALAPEPEPSETEPETGPDPDAETREAPEPADPPAAEPSAADGSFMVQVGSFSSDDTASGMTDRLEALGHSASSDVVVRGEASLHRVRTGPYRTRSDAERAMAQIAATVAGVEPVVVSAPADNDAPAERASGFSVQVGSFTSRANADRLTEQLIGQGYDAFIHPDETGPREIWRVRVGTAGSRDEAASLRRELLDDAGLEGLIVSHP